MFKSRANERKTNGATNAINIWEIINRSSVYTGIKVSLYEYNNQIEFACM